jgi:GNAT superfamily N-acetyltransferase
MSGLITYSVRQPSVDLAESVFQLHEQVYGDATALRQRWNWEFMQHPRHAEIRTYCAEQGGCLVGFTARHPVTLSVQGQPLAAWFASNSMVHPSMRGQGIIRTLYMQALEDAGAVQLSKGTAEGMYAVLKKIGYREIMPNTYQVCILDPFRWLLQRLSGLSSSSLQTDEAEAHPHLLRLAEKIPEDIAAIRCDGILKDADYLTWRYRTIPHKKYALYVRRVNGRPVSFLALRQAGGTVYLVDLIWDQQAQDEPHATISTAKQEARKMGAYKLIAWSDHRMLRSALKSKLFFERSDTPYFSYALPANSCENLVFRDISFTHGDGDIDYL